MSRISKTGIKRMRPVSLFNMIIFGLILCAGAYNAMAQPATSCAPELMQAMEARAWMETDREMIQNQNLMPRPDSVMEYSCFDQLVSLVGEIPAEIFSDNESAWVLSTGGLPQIDNVSTDVALQEVVGVSLFTFLFSNFGHTYIGDRTALLGAAAPRAPGDYDCNALNYVWEQAKCMDFGEFRESYTPGRTDFDMFYDFNWYENNDPRDLPEDPPACTPANNLWDKAIKTSFNDDHPDRQADRYILPESDEVLFDTTPYEVEFVEPAPGALTDRYMRMMIEADHPLFGSCITISTGIPVTRQTGTSGTSASYTDATCPNPQCFFDRNTCDR